MRLYCPNGKCNCVYDTVMGDFACPMCGTEMETKPRENRTYGVEIGTL